MTSSFVSGRSGNKTLRIAREKAIAKGLKPTIYTHPIGYHGHGASPSIGSWAQHNGSPGTGDYPMRANTAYSIELNAIEEVPDGTISQCALCSKLMVSSAVATFTTSMADRLDCCWFQGHRTQTNEYQKNRLQQAHWNAKLQFGSAKQGLGVP